MMAPWHADMYLFAINDKLPNTNETGWCPPRLPPPQIIEAHHFLFQYLGEPWMVSEDWFAYGPEQGSRIDVICEQGGAATLVSRFDLRNEGWHFPGLACRLAQQLGCQLFSPDLNGIIDAHPAALQMALAEISPSAAVSQDQSAYNDAARAGR